MAISFYSTLFTTSQSDRVQLSRGHFPLIPPDKLLLLQALCTHDEVTKAIQAMSPHKSPGPDGFSAGFFQRTWETTGQSVTQMVKQVLNGGDLPTGLAEALLVLVPKTKLPQTITQFRPIILCNMAYKVITKLITTRLKEVLGVFDCTVSVQLRTRSSYDR